MAGEVEYLKKHPTMASVLRAAVLEEAKHASEQGYLGWTWDQVRAYPASLMAMVVGGVIRVNFKSNSQTRYLLVSRAATKQALAGGASHRSVGVRARRRTPRSR